MKKTPRKTVAIRGMSENNGGIEAVIFYIFKTIDRDKYNFVFIKRTKNKVAFEDEILQMGGEIYYMPFIRKLNFIKYRQEWKRFFETHSIDIMHDNMTSFVNVDALLYSKKFNVPVRIAHWHNTNDLVKSIRKILWNYHQKHILSYATKLVACSQMAGKFGFKNKDYIVFKNGIDLDKYKFNGVGYKLKKEYNINNKMVIGNVARVCPIKNQSFLLDILYELNKQVEAVLMLVGNPEAAYEKELKEKIELLNLRDCVIFVGIVQNTEEFYNAFDVFLLPSLFEGLPVVCVEAQANGLYCICSKEGVPAETNITGKVEYLSLNASAEKWASKCIELSKRKRYDALDKLEESGYSCKNMGKIMEGIYDS